MISYTELFTGYNIPLQFYRKYSHKSIFSWYLSKPVKSIHWIKALPSYTQSNISQLCLFFFIISTATWKCLYMLAAFCLVCVNNEWHIIGAFCKDPQSDQVITNTCLTVYYVTCDSVCGLWAHFAKKKKKKQT